MIQTVYHFTEAPNTCINYALQHLEAIKQDELREKGFPTELPRIVFNRKLHDARTIRQRMEDHLKETFQQEVENELLYMMREGII